MGKMIACDLDGTLAEYNGFKGIGHIGAAIPSVAERIKAERAAGNEVWLFTARVSDIDSEEALEHINNWLLENDIEVDGITAVKKKEFAEFWDDRAITVIKNTGLFLDVKPMPTELATKIADVLAVMQNGAFNTQVGGDHYKRLHIQTGVFCALNNFGHYESSIIKYAARHQFKNGLQDLEKLIQCAKQLAAIRYGAEL